ncbi:hypothetical protein L0F63_002669 [Massospora cicadina]|nr:hypothetical protein L0F63_002669 [Massospora cicadina]
MNMPSPEEDRPAAGKAYPPSFIAKLWRFGPPSSPDPRVGTSRTAHSLSASPRDVGWRRTPLRKSSSVILPRPGDGLPSPKLQPPKGMRAEPKVEISRPYARSEAFCHSPGSLSTVSIPSEAKVGPESGLSADTPLSETSSATPLRVSLASQGWVPSGSAAETVIGNDSPAEPPREEKELATRLEPPSRASWWGFSNSTPQAKTSWWPSFLAAAETYPAAPPDTRCTPAPTPEVKGEVTREPATAVEPCECPLESAVIGLDFKSNGERVEARVEPTESPQPSCPGYEPSFVVRSMQRMLPTWRYFFSSPSTQQALRSRKDVKLVEDADGALIRHQPTPPPPAAPTAAIPAYKEATLQTSTTCTPPNLVLPVLDVASLHFAHRPTLLRRAMDAFTYYTGLRFGELRHAYACPHPPQPIRRVVVVGIHGWFPLKIYQKVVGSPTGTSEKFCRLMAEALQAYLRDHFGGELGGSSITPIPLHCEGKVEFRVTKLYSRLLSNPAWMAGLAGADHVLVAAHSQGTPVAVLLLDRLIRDGLLDPATQRTSILAMAGVSHGPFPSLKENYIVKYFEAEAARELFEFMDPAAPIVVQYNGAMARVVASGVSVCAVASMVDQVVPLYSGIMHGYEHPSIRRALYIDGINYAPDFLTSLIVFALLLRNHGRSDGGLILHLSDLVAGSLYSGTPGHSTIYEERKVYTAAIQWHFAPQPPPTKLVINPVDAHRPLNPYHLPWIMRGLVEDLKVTRHPYLKLELAELRDQFALWKPATKLLKDLKFRLDPIKPS